MAELQEAVQSTQILGIGLTLHYSEDFQLLNSSINTIPKGIKIRLLPVDNCGNSQAYEEMRRLGKRKTRSS